MLLILISNLIFYQMAIYMHTLKKRNLDSGVVTCSVYINFFFFFLTDTHTYILKTAVTTESVNTSKRLNITTATGFVAEYIKIHTTPHEQTHC